MTGKYTSMNVFNTFLKKQISFKVESSCMQLLYSTLEQYLHKADRTFLSSVSILKSFADGHFLKVIIDTVSFLQLDIFWVFECVWPICRVGTWRVKIKDQCECAHK